MGRDKAFLDLAGKPLVLHAVVKLRRVCMEVSILGDNPSLDAYAPLVRDVHPDCGPMGGMEAALLHSRYDWNLFLPVDMPFLPTAYLSGWLRQALPEESGVRHMWRQGFERRAGDARVRMLMVDGVPGRTGVLVARLDSAQNSRLPRHLTSQNATSRRRTALTGYPAEYNCA
jgi:hypothetical protein